MILALWTLLTFTLPSFDGGPNCTLSPYPIGDQLLYISVECSHDSLHWAEVARWGARHTTAGTPYRIVAWPDTTKPVWYRVLPVDTLGNKACPGNAVRVK
jgi:hypothetical protein